MKIHEQYDIETLEKLIKLSFQLNFLWGTGRKNLKIAMLAKDCEFQKKSEDFKKISALAPILILLS